MFYTCVLFEYLMWKLSPYGSTEKAAHKDLLAQIRTILQWQTQTS